MSLTDMLVKQREVRDHSRTAVVSSRALTFQPSSVDGMKGIEVYGPNGHGYNPTHWAFSQLAFLAKGPAGYLRTLPAPIAADNLNYGMRFARDVEDTSVLITRMGDADFLNKRFTKSVTTGAMQAHIDEEGRPIETLWDAVTGVTAYARALPHQDARIDIERKAGEMLALAA